MHLNEDAITEAVIERATERLLDEHDFVTAARRQISDRVNALFADQVEGEVASIVREATRAGFETVYQPVNRLGQPDGPETTIRKRLVDLVENYWAQRVSKRSGEPQKDSYDSVSRAEWTMAQICAGDFSAALRQEVVNLTATIKDGLREQLRTEVDKMLGEIFRVRSKADTAEGRRNG